MPLVAPLPTDHDHELKTLAEFFQTTLGFQPNSVLTMQRRPPIARAFIALNKAVMENHGQLTSELKRLVALVASANAGCRYCQAHASLAAQRFGATPERLASVWAFRDSPHFTEAERAAFELALAASSVPNAMDEALAQRVRAHWSEADIVEMMGVIALFGFLNRWNDTMATALEPAAKDHAANVLGPHGWQAGKHGESDNIGSD